MKHYVISIILLLFTITNAYSQETKSDNRPQIMKEDAGNHYNSDQITKLDLIQALESVGISIYKFQIGTFTKKYNLSIFVDEYKEGILFNTDTVYEGDNEYHYYVRGKEGYFLDYIDQIKIFPKVKDSSLTMQFVTYKGGFGYKKDFEKSDNAAFYNLRKYTDTKWLVNEKIPLFVYASSWEDTNGGFQRFCGSAELARHDKDTEELLFSSPHYFSISYIISEIE